MVSVNNRDDESDEISDEEESEDEHSKHSNFLTSKNYPTVKFVNSEYTVV